MTKKRKTNPRAELVRLVKIVGSHAAAAELIGVHRTTVGKWVRDEHRIPYAVASLISYLVRGGVPPAAK